MRGRDVVLEAFRKYNVRYIFGNPGTTELPMMDGLVNYPDIEYVLGLHEDTAVGMAAGYAQAAGTVGVVNLHITPGLAHGLGNIYDAYRAGVPLVVTAGQHDSRLAIQEPALAGDLVNMVKPFTKWSYEVHQAEELPIALQRAFKLAQTAPTGPVFLSLPNNVMMQETNVSPLDLTHIEQTSEISQSVADKAAKWLMEAQNCVVIVGDRVGQTDAVSETVELCEQIAAKVYGEHQSSGFNFPYTHPLFFGRGLPNGPYLKEILSGADVVLLLGVTSQAPLLYFAEPVFGDETKVIQVDVSEWELGKNAHAHCAILADLKAAVKAIGESVRRQLSLSDSQQETGSSGQADALRSRIEQRRTDLAGLQEKRQKELQDALTADWESQPISPARVVAELAQVLPKDAFVVDESVTSGRYVHSYLPMSRPNSLISLKGGGLGYGIAAAMGAQLARPNERVVATIGDGSALYYIQSLWTAAKYNLPVVYVILNNQSYMILKGGLQRMNGPAAQKGIFPGMDIVGPSVDFAACARSFGVEGIRVEDPDELQAALQKALAANRPVLLDVVIDGTIKPFLQ